MVAELAHEPIRDIPQHAEFRHLRRRGEWRRQVPRHAGERLPGSKIPKVVEAVAEPLPEHLVPEEPETPRGPRECLAPGFRNVQELLY